MPASSRRRLTASAPTSCTRIPRTGTPGWTATTASCSTVAMRCSPRSGARPPELRPPHPRVDPARPALRPGGPGRGVAGGPERQLHLQPQPRRRRSHRALRQLLLRAQRGPSLTMTGVFDGLEVLDLSWGISGPIVSMLLADHGARVTKIEPPGGDPSRSLLRRAGLAPRQAQRGARPARRPAIATVCSSPSPRTPTSLRRELLARAPPQRLGIDYETLLARQPAARVLLDHRLRRRRRARRPARLRRARRRAHRTPVGEPRGVAGGDARPRCRAWTDRARRPRRPRRLLGGRARVRVRCSPGVPWVSLAARLPRHARHQRRAARARADRPRPAGVDVAVAGRARHDAHRPGSGSSTSRRAELPELDRRPARAEGRVPLRRRPLGPPVGAPPRLRPRVAEGDR